MKTTNIIFISICFCLLTNFMYASPKDKTITIGYTENGWIPYSSDNGEKGIMVDVIKIISNKLGYKVIVKMLPPKRLTKELETKYIEARTKAKEWIDNPEDYYWTDPIDVTRDVLILKKGKLLEVKSFKDIQKLKSIGVMHGFSYPKLEKYFKSGIIKREDLKSTLSLLKFLKLERSDAIVTNKYVALWMIKNSPEFSIDMFRFGVSIDEVGYRVQFSKNEDWRPFIREFNKELKLMKEDGRYQKILDTYLK